MQHPFPYEIIYSNRKSIAIQITAQATVRVRAPRNCPGSAIDAFLCEKQNWILKHLDSASARLKEAADRPQISDDDRKRYIALARDIFTRKTEYYARIWASPTAVSRSGNKRPAGEAAPALEI